MLAAVQYSEQVVMNLAYPAQIAEYTPSYNTVTMPTPDSRRPGIEDATKTRGFNQITHVEVAPRNNYLCTKAQSLLFLILF